MELGLRRPSQVLKAHHSMQLQQQSSISCQAELAGRLEGAEAELAALGEDLAARDAEAASLARALADARRTLGSGGAPSKSGGALAWWLPCGVCLG